jgi:hypothetical protein
MERRAAPDQVGPSGATPFVTWLYRRIAILWGMTSIIIAHGHGDVERRKDQLVSLVLAVPILSGRAEAWRRMCQELIGSRAQVFKLGRLSAMPH